MNRIHAIALLTIATLSATVGARAQQRAVIANIPFNFTVADEVLPAGEYSLSTSTSGIVQIQSANHQLFVKVTASHSNHEAEARTELVFSRYGSNYFLHQILDPHTSSLNVDIGSSKSERKARAHQEEAKLPPTESVLVAAR